MKSWEDERSCDSCDSILWDGLDGPSPAICLCACVTLSLQKCSYPENCTLPSIPYAIHGLRPLCLLPQINTHTHIAPTPWGAAGASSGGLWRGKKAFRRTVICFSPAVDHGQAKKKKKKKPPLFLHLSPFLAAPAKKLGRAALWKERKAGRQQIPLSVCTAKRNGLI